MIVPAGLGPFTFPAPYGTPGIRLTNASNAEAGCETRMYAYWPVVNNHRGQSHLYVIIGRRQARPLVLLVMKATGEVRIHGEVPIDENAEGWYFAETRPTAFYFLEGARLRRYDVFDGRRETVATLDPRYGDNLWQAHSSADDTVHSATVRRVVPEGRFPVLGTVVFRKGTQRFIPATGVVDESQIDRSGRWLTIQEDNDLLVYDLDRPDAAPRRIPDQDGAPAHLDVGDALAVGEDNWHEAGALVAWDLADPHSQRRLLHATGGASLGHVAVRGGRWLLSSNATNELLEGPLAGGGAPRLVAPGLCGDPGQYDQQLRANWDPTGEYACWIGFPDGRPDALLVRVGAAAPIVVRPPAPPVPPDPPAGDDMIASYESLGGDAAAPPIGAALLADYAEAGRALDEGFAIWTWRTCYDALSMGVPASLRVHRREWRRELGLAEEPA